MNLTPFALQVFKIAVFAIVVSIGLRTRPVDSLHLMHHWQKGVKAFVALFIIVPAAMIAVALILPMPPAVQITLIALSVAPMSPTLPNALAKLGADHPYCVSLEVIGAGMALIAAPLVFWIVSNVAGEDISIGKVGLIVTLAKGVVVPLTIGILLALALPALAARLANAIVSVASPVLLGAIVLILWSNRALIVREVDWMMLLSIVLLVVVGLAAGHALGGPSEYDRRALALTAASRHLGFAIAAGTAVAPNSVATVSAVCMIYYVVRGIVVRPYTTRIKGTDGRLRVRT